MFLGNFDWGVTKGYKRTTGSKVRETPANCKLDDTANRISLADLRYDARQLRCLQ